MKPPALPRSPAPVRRAAPAMRQAGAVLAALAGGALLVLAAPRAGRLGYAVVAALLFAGTWAWPLRRRLLRVRALGPARPYRQLHLYAGALFVLFAVLPAGPLRPAGPLGGAVWLLGAAALASGLAVVALQRWIPPRLAALSVEVPFDRLPVCLETTRRQAEQLVATSAPAVRDFYRQHAAAGLARLRPRLGYWRHPPAALPALLPPFDALRDRLPADEHARLAALRALYRTKLELDAHYTLQRALRRTVRLHALLSLAFTLLLALQRL